jgi:catechol 2,3-dioxygenase-like lactoylglutathione lyase family enzyme
VIAGGLVTLGVKDVGTAERFYIETLGMKLVADGIIDAGDGFLFELRAGAPPLDRASAVTFFPKVPLAQARSIFEMRGVVFGSDNDFQDPDGNKLRLCDRPV